MEHFHTCDSVACISCIYNHDITLILEEYDDFIRMLARQNVPRPRPALADEIEKDIEDLVQLTWIKLWRALEHKGCHIRDMKAYIRRIVRNQVIDLCRRNKHTEFQIPDDDGEIAQTYTLIASSQIAQNPLEVVEEAEMLASYSGKLTAEVLAFPRVQQHAMICSLKDQIGDLLSFVDMFQPYGIDVENMDWPEAENELRSSRTSLSIARKKIRANGHDDWY